MGESDLIIFYLLTSAIHTVPLVVITLTLMYGKPFQAMSFMLGHRAPANRGLRNIGMARFQQFFELFESGFMRHLTRYYILASGVQFLTLALVILAIIYDLPLPFKPNLNDVLPPGTMHELFMLSITAAFLQLLPVILLLLAIYYGIPIPFLPRRPENRVQLSNEIRRWERKSRAYASIRLLRFENRRRTLIYARCRDDRLGTIFKAALYQRNEPGATTQCFLYTNGNPPVRQVIPAPISIHQVDEVFGFVDD